MTERSMAFDQVVQAKLRFIGSDALRDVIDKSLVKPELRREFAQRSFYLYLRTEEPVNVTYHFGSTDQPLHSKDLLDEYNAGIAQRHKGKDIYRNHYQLSSNVIGGAEYEDPYPGVSLLFRVAMSGYEQTQLLAPPFNEATAGPVYVTHEIHNAWLVGTPNRASQYQQMRIALGAYHPESRERGYLNEKYYLTHPEGVVVESQYRDATPTDGTEV